MDRERELRANIAVTLVTQFGLRLFCQTAMQPAALFAQFRHRKEILLGRPDPGALGIARGFHQVGRVTVVAAHAMLQVFGMPELFLVAAALVTGHTPFGIFFGTSMELEDELGCSRRLSVISFRGFLGVGVGFPCAVTHLTARDSVLGGRQGRVGRLSKFNRFGAVAGAASFRTHEPAIGCKRNVCRRDLRRFGRRRPGLGKSKYA